MGNLNSKDFNYWARRATEMTDHRSVSIADPIQKDLEIHFINSQRLEFGDLLEIGCGNGIMTKYFESNATSVTAIDVSEEMISRALSDFEFASTTRLQLGDACNLTFPDNFFDTVVLVRVLINIHDRTSQEIALNEAHRVLKPGGHMILIEGAEESFKNINSCRAKLALPSINPSPVNLYLDANFFENIISSKFTLVSEINSGIYDFFTRVMFSGPDDTRFEFTLLDVKRKLLELLDFSGDFSLLQNCSRLDGGLFQKK